MEGSVFLLVGHVCVCQLGQAMVPVMGQRYSGCFCEGVF